MPPHPHAHGGDDEEEEVKGPRIDGPPFIDLVAKQGRGFDADYSSLQVRAPARGRARTPPAAHAAPFATPPVPSVSSAARHRAAAPGAGRLLARRRGDQPRLRAGAWCR
jgi:hypothetical protein